MDRFRHGLGEFHWVVEFIASETLRPLRFPYSCKATATAALSSYFFSSIYYWFSLFPGVFPDHFFLCLTEPVFIFCIPQRKTGYLSCSVQLMSLLLVLLMLFVYDSVVSCSLYKTAREWRRPSRSPMWSIEAISHFAVSSGLPMPHDLMWFCVFVSSEPPWVRLPFFQRRSIDCCLSLCSHCRIYVVELSLPDLFLCPEKTRCSDVEGCFNSFRIVSSDGGSLGD